MSLRLALLAALLLCTGCGARTALDGGESESEGGGGTRHVPKSCKQQGVTYIYVVLTDKRIFAFDPPTATFSPRGVIDCPSGSNAFSMAVNRKGVALVELEDGNVVEVDTKDGSCDTTAYTFDPGFKRFGMGYSADADDNGETLFIGSDDGRLGTLDPVTLERAVIGPFSRPIGAAELTGTADHRLFAFALDGSKPRNAHLAEIDPTDARVLSDKLILVGAGANTWAFANWGGAFYFFTGAAGDTASKVTKYDPDARSIAHVADAPGLIVGSGVSTCAPL